MSLSNNGNGMGPADIAAVVNGGCGYGGMGGFGGGWGNGGIWDILVLFILLGLFGNGGWGFGGGQRGGCGCCNPCATPADVNSAVDRQTFIGKLDGITNGICDSTYAVTGAITNGFSQAEISRCQMQAAFMQQLNAMAADAAKCCCETQRGMERGFAEIGYNMATQACETRNLIQNTTRDITDNANANTRAILDFLTKDKIDSLTSENQALRLKASQAEQNAVFRAAIDASTAEIIRRTGNECPSPAYFVPNPHCCYGNPLGVGYSGWNGGGCGNCA